MRIRVSEIRETGRNAQGVKLLSLKDGEKPQDVARVIPDGVDSTAEGEEGEAPAADAEE